MGQTKSVAVASLLIDLECELRKLSLWQSEAPDESALSSTEPFCIDTLSFSQWLQFVFIVRLRRLIEQQQALPVNSSIAPMSEEYFKGQGVDVAALLRVITDLDRYLSV